MRTILKRICGMMLIILMIIPIISSLAIQLFADEMENNEFVGYSEQMERTDLEEATNTTKLASGEFSNPISDNSPQITILIPGYNSNASSWSNNYNNEETVDNLVLSYNEDSLVEKLRDIANAKVYLALSTAYYQNVEKRGNSVISDGQLVNNSFELYECNDICTVADCEECNIENNLDEWYDFESNYNYGINRVTHLTDISNHIVVLFSPIDSTSSNSKIYEQLDYVIDKIVYDVKVLNGGALPKINLIAHSRGSVNAMEYAINHPWLVDSLITIGGVFGGSRLSEFDFVMNLVKKSNDKNSQYYSTGVDDILNSEVYNNYKEQWNNSYEELYSHINFLAIGGYCNSDFIINLMKNSDFTNYTGYSELINIIGELLEYIDNETIIDDILLQDFTLQLLADTIEGFDPNSEDHKAVAAYIKDLLEVEGNIFDKELVIYDDLFIHLDSQLANGYKGVQTYKRKFTAEEGTVNYNMVSKKEVNIVHNLEQGDADIHNQIITRIDTGSGYADSLFYVELKSDNTYKITGIRQGYSETILSIPTAINSIPVTEIGNSAFSELGIESLFIAESVKIIGRGAFENCTNLEIVNLHENSQLEQICSDAFKDCTEIVSFEFVDSLKSIGNFAFSNTGLSEINLNANLEYLGTGAFYLSPITSYTVDTGSNNFTSEAGVLYNYDKSMLIAYPNEKKDSVVTVPSFVSIIGSYAFSCNEHVVSIDLNSVTTIEDYSFLNCIELEQVIGDLVNEVSANSFKNTKFINTEFVSLGDTLIKCNSDSEVITINDYKHIKENAFLQASNLKTIYLGGKINSLESNAFSCNNNLENIYFVSGNTVYISKESFDMLPNLENIYVPCFLIEQYNSDLSWSTYNSYLSVHKTIVHFEATSENEIENTEFNYYQTIDDLPIPQRNAYTFDGWVIYEDGVERIVECGYIWLSLEEEVTLHAQWTPIEYLVKFNTNGGAVDNETIFYTTEISVEFPIPAKQGYTFIGWYDNEAFEGEAFSGLDTGNYGNREYYAKWQANSYNVTLNLGYETTEDPQTATVIYGNSFELFVPTREGYMFNGWSHNGIMYTNEQGKSNLNWNVANDTILIASWTKEKYYVQINANGTIKWLTRDGNFSADKTSIEYGTVFANVDEINMAFNPDKTSLKDGYKFAYFTEQEPNENITLEEFEFWNGQVIDLGENERIVTLYAHFVPEINFSIVFDGFVSSSSGEYINPIYANYQDSISLWTPEKSGYTFVHWIVKQCDENTRYVNTVFTPGTVFSYTAMPDLSPGVEEDGAHIYLQAIFTPNSITIEYEVDGIIWSNDSIEYDSTDFDFKVPTKKGYEFDGWYDENGVKYSNEAGKLITTWKKPQNTVLVAKFTAIEYTINYILNEGTNNSDNPTNYTIETSTITLKNPTKSGYRFMGWYKEPTFVTRVTNISKGTTGNITLYANWKDLYTVKFECNGTVQKTITGIKGETIYAPESPIKGHLYVNGNYRLKANDSYTITGCVTFKSETMTLDECYNEKTKTYEIYNLYQLKSIKDKETPRVYGEYKLMNDIRLADNEQSNTPWIPIRYLYGTFDGNGHTVEMLICKSYTEQQVSDLDGDFGLFASNYGWIKNLTIDAYINDVENTWSEEYVNAGMVAGYNIGQISNVTVKCCTVNTYFNAAFAGGIVGSNGGTISNCEVIDLTINAKGDAGGIAGHCGNGIITNCKVTNAKIYVVQKGSNPNIGGIVGKAIDGSTIEYCYVNNVQIIHSGYSDIDISEVAPCIGTVVGYLENSKMNYIGEKNSGFDYGDLPEVSGWWWWEYHYPRQNIGGYATYCGKMESSTITNTTWTPST